MPDIDAADWWRQATVYQIYPRSFADANGDGIGDLKGITSKVGYLKQLGVDAVWLSPFFPSPLKDGGCESYLMGNILMTDDVSDYRDVDPNIGSLADFDEMMTAFKDVGIKVIIDIVPNHSSDEHEWFEAALKSKAGSPERARFHFQDGMSKVFRPADDQGLVPTNLPPLTIGTACSEAPPGSQLATASTISTCSTARSLTSIGTTRMSDRTF